MNKKTTKRILFINWKWTFLNKQGINDKHLESYVLEDFLEKFCSKNKKDSFFNTFPVGKIQPTDKKEIGWEIEQDAAVVCCNIYNGTQSKKVLHHLIGKIHQKYQADYEKVEIFLFLHRGHYYTYEDVLQILHTDHLQKCFLFEAGHDYIYYHTEKEGLLDDIGEFFVGRDESPHKIETCYERGKEKMIHLDYFNNVWRYYKQEFKLKVKGLFIDFVKAIFSFKSWKKERFDKIELIRHFEELNQISFEDKGKGRLIYYRLKSFLGCYDTIQLKLNLNSEDREPLNQNEYHQLNRERKILAEFEEKNNQSYTFDDVRANLKHKHKDDKKDIEAHDIYIELNKLMRSLFLQEVAYNKKIHKNDILKIRDKMERLIKTLLGSNL